MAGAGAGGLVADGTIQWGVLSYQQAQKISWSTAKKVSATILSSNIATLETSFLQSLQQTCHFFHGSSRRRLFVQHGQKKKGVAPKR